MPIFQVSDQQNTLDRAGVPGFVLSNKEVDIKLQMYLLGFISELSRREDEKMSVWKIIYTMLHKYHFIILCETFSCKINLFFIYE